MTTKTFQDAIDQTLGHGFWSFLRRAMLLKYNIEIGMPRAPVGMLDKPWNDNDVERLIEIVLAQGDFDALIVDDHSPDGTGEIADALAERHPNRVAVLHRADKQGLRRRPPIE